MELPLNIMDTALFYPCYLGLSPKQARKVMSRVVDAAVRFGGCVTVNWHDRSPAPERQWGEVYRELVHELADRGAWFATAEQAVAWFRSRRCADLKAGDLDANSWGNKDSGSSEGELPGLCVRAGQPPACSRI